jgi:NAD(P)-dependent dehydrogenase (short-subunit alcohol dehydrogenase family)
LARRLSSTRIASNSFEPGGVASNFARNNGPVSWLRHLVAHALRRDLVSPRKGAEPLVYLASSDQVAGITEKHFRRSREVEPSFASRDVEEARRLWDLSLELTKLKRDPAFGTRALLV